MNRYAVLSDDGVYRYSLSRVWDTTKPEVCFVGLNPSTADAIKDDPTIRRCIRFAKDWGYGSLIMRNLFPFRATDPKELLKNPSTVRGGERGDTELLTAMTADLVVMAWGASVPFNRDIEALKLFECFPAKPIHCLELTKHGKPRHPLYVKADKQPQLFRGPQD